MTRQDCKNLPTPNQSVTSDSVNISEDPSRSGMDWGGQALFDSLANELSLWILHKILHTR